MNLRPLLDLIASEIAAFKRFGSAGDIIPQSDRLVRIRILENNAKVALRRR
jgi:hypothetical protein